MDGPLKWCVSTTTILAHCDAGEQGPSTPSGLTLAASAGRADQAAAKLRSRLATRLMDKVMLRTTHTTVTPSDVR